ncbi:hypothetical protein NPIL_3931, partial [Nephila pilipes]
GFKAESRTQTFLCLGSVWALHWEDFEMPVVCSSRPRLEQRYPC